MESNRVTFIAYRDAKLSSFEMTLNMNVKFTKSNYQSKVKTAIKLTPHLYFKFRIVCFLVSQNEIEVLLY